MRLEHGRPWVIAKWAANPRRQDGNGRRHTLDFERASREVVQQLRGRVDAIIVGSGTARTDDPLLTARPEEPGRREAEGAPRGGRFAGDAAAARVSL